MAYTIKNWLKGMVGDYEITDSTFESILFNNGLDADTPAVETSEMERDLSLADLYMAIATSSSKSGSIYDSDGGWQKGRATKNVVDRSWFREQANRLYAKWNSDKTDTTGLFVMKNLY